MITRRSTKVLQKNRKGAALVEFAVCLPVIVLIVLGSIEATSAVFVRQSLAVSAYEGIRQAVRRDGDAASATAKAQAVLEGRSVRSATIEFIPANFDAAQRGEEVAIRVSARVRDNSPLFGKVLEDRLITVTTTMVRE